MNAFEKHQAGFCKEYLEAAYRCQAGESRASERLETLAFRLRLSGIEADSAGRDLRTVITYLEDLGLTDDTEAYVHELSRLEEAVKDGLRQGLLTDTTEKAEEICALVAGHFGANSPCLDSHLLARATIYHRVGELERAEELYQEVIERFETYRGPDYPMLADSRSRLADLGEERVSLLASKAAQCSQEGRFQEAEVCFRQSLELAYQVHGEKSLTYGALASDLAELHSHQGSLRQAAEWGRRAESILTSLSASDIAENDRELYQVSLNQLALVYSRAGDDARAEKLLLILKADCEATEGPDSPWTLWVVNNLVDTHLSMGHLADAEILLQGLLQKVQENFAGDSPEYARVLASLGSLAGIRGNFPQALEHHQVAVANERARLGRHPDLVVGLNNLAEAHRKLGQFAEAKALYQEALDILEAAFPNGHPKQALCLSNLGDLLQTLGKFQAAEKHQRRALAVQEEFFPEPTGQTATILRSLANLCQNLACFAEAKSHYQRLLEIRRARGQEKTVDHALDLAGLASLHESLGELDQARALLHEVRRIQDEALDPETPVFLDGQLAMARLSGSLGEYDAARKDLLQLLRLREKSLGEAHPDLGLILFQLATLDLHAARYAAARSQIERAIALLGKFEIGHPNLCAALLLRAEILRLTGDPEEAIENSRWVCGDLEGVIGDEHPFLAHAYQALALALHQGGELEEAEVHILHALAIFQKVFISDHPIIATALLHLAALRQERGDLDDSRSHLQTAVDILFKTLGGHHWQYASASRELAQVQERTGHTNDAEKAYSQALAILEPYTGYHHQQRASCRHGLGRIRARQCRFLDAHSLLLASLQDEDRMIDGVMGSGSVRQRLNFLYDTTARLHDLLSVTAEGLSEDIEALRATFEVLLSRKSVSVELFARQRATILTGQNKSLKGNLKKLDQAQQALAALDLAGHPLPDVSMGMSTWRHLSYALQRTIKEQLETRLVNGIPELEKLGEERRAAASRVTQAIPAGACLVEIVHFLHASFGFPGKEPTRHYAAFVVRAGGGHLMWVDLGPANVIDQLISDFHQNLLEQSELRRDVLKKSSGAASRGDLGSCLRRALIDPIRLALGGARKVFIAPDGELARLPFEIIPISRSEDFIDAYEITYLNCGRDLITLSCISSGEAERPVVIADPAYDLPTHTKEPPTIDSVEREEESHVRGSGSARALFDLICKNQAPLEQLPEAREEGNRVAGALAVECICGEQALKGRVKKLRSPAILHLATHGFFEPLIPAEGTAPQHADPSSRTSLSNPLLRSGLAFAGFNNALRGEKLSRLAEDAILTAEDVTGLDLTHTELVVLSACSSGLGEVWSGEGLFGLRRAFTIAGARTLVLSLWSVGDRPTRILMEHFYKKVLAGMSCSEALRQARLAVREVFPSPWDWGAFILHGYPGPLRFQNSAS